MLCMPGAGATGMARTAGWAAPSPFRLASSRILPPGRVENGTSTLLSPPRGPTASVRRGGRPARPRHSLSWPQTRVPCSGLLRSSPRGHPRRARGERTPFVQCSCVRQSDERHLRTVDCRERAETPRNRSAAASTRRSDCCYRTARCSSNTGVHTCPQGRKEKPCVCIVLST